MLLRNILILFLFFLFEASGKSFYSPTIFHSSLGEIGSKEILPNRIKTGAEQTGKYLPYLKGKKVGMVINQTSMIGNKTSVDSLRVLGINIIKIFAPEHGFRGHASDGHRIENSIDPDTGIPVFSLYGAHFKPRKEEIEDLDILIFDIQDVGARFYTYISTLHYVMEACAENGLELIILDRPNPNGFYVDGPVLEEKFKSFVGMHPVPIVHGMTIAEYAQMINGEGWLKNKIKCKLKIVKLRNYIHSSTYKVPAYPSPNLNSQQSILLYPSLCLFEGTVISVGRGTRFPFQVLGNPELKGEYRFNFTPMSIKGMSETPLHQSRICYGVDLRQYNVNQVLKARKLNLSWLIAFYKAYPFKEKFFDYKQSKQMGNFDRLAGTDKLREQIIAQKSESEIRLTWKPALMEYKKMRNKYLLYQ